MASSSPDDVLEAFLDLTVPYGYRAELIDGVIIVSPPPSGAHQSIVAPLARRIARDSAADLYTSSHRGWSPRSAGTFTGPP